MTFRRFRTSKINRSLTIKRYIIPLNLFSIKEIAFEIKHIGRRKHHKLNLTKQKRLVPYAMIVFGIIGVSIFSFEALRIKSVDPPKTFSDFKLTQPTSFVPIYSSLPASVPISISIPSQNISANIVQVGKAADGSIQMPPVLDWETGWYEYSPTPGQIGPSVIVGHVDNYKNISVFWRLRYLAAGDKIYITRADGSNVEFEVNSLQQYNQNNFPTQLVYGNIPYAGLRLITCGGTFDKSTGSYDQNTVVYATYVPTSTTKKL